MNIQLQNILLLLLAFTLMSSCNEEAAAKPNRSKDALARYGAEVKMHDGTKDYENIYGDYGNNKEITEIITDYLGRSSELLNLEQKSREFKADYIEYQFLVDDLPMDLKNINTIFSSEDRHEFKGRRENVVMEFIKKDDQGVRSQHTSVMTFSPLANSEDPVMKYGFLNKSSDPQSQLHIKKIKSKDYNFNGTVAKYYVGARSPFKSEKLNISYDVDSKSYQYSRDDGSPKSINVDAVSDLYSSYNGELTDDMKYGAIVDNIKKSQNKNIRSGGYYKLEGITRFLTNMELGKDFPLRELKYGEALMRHNGTSLSDGKSYIKLVMPETQIVLLVDVDGYISQYQQVTVDKEKGIVEKIVLLRK